MNRIKRIETLNEIANDLERTSNIGTEFRMNNLYFLVITSKHN